MQTLPETAIEQIPRFVPLFFRIIPSFRRAYFRHEFLEEIVRKPLREKASSADFFSGQHLVRLILQHVRIKEHDRDFTTGLRKSVFPVGIREFDMHARRIGTRVALDRKSVV